MPTQLTRKSGFVRPHPLRARPDLVVGPSFSRNSNARVFPAASLANPWIAGSASHCDKLTFRAFLPVLNQVTAGGYWDAGGDNHVAAIFDFPAHLSRCLRLAADTVVSTAVTWAFAASWAGSCGFNDFVNGDAVAMALLLGAMVTRTSGWSPFVSSPPGLTMSAHFVSRP